MKVIRAERGVFVPHNPENPDNNSMRLVGKGLLALIPDNFQLPKGSYQDLGKLKLEDQKNKPKGD